MYFWLTCCIGVIFSVHHAKRHMMLFITCEEILWDHKYPIPSILHPAVSRTHWKVTHTPWHRCLATPGSPRPPSCCIFLPIHLCFPLWGQGLILCPLPTPSLPVTEVCTEQGLHKCLSIKINKKYVIWGINTSTVAPFRKILLIANWGETLKNTNVLLFICLWVIQTKSFEWYICKEERKVGGDRERGEGRNLKNTVNWKKAKNKTDDTVPLVKPKNTYTKWFYTIYIYIYMCPHVCVPLYLRACM